MARDIHPIDLNPTEEIVRDVVLNDNLVFTCSDLEGQHRIRNCSIGSIAISPVSHAISQPPRGLPLAPVIGYANEGGVKLCHFG
jgi:hypothetical protein